MDFTLEKDTGYMYCYSPKHPYANKSGKVREHTYVMCNTIGRTLRSDECVHHINRNRSDNRISNLRLMTISEHSLLHQVEDRGCKVIFTECPTCCKQIMTTEVANQKYCSYECSHISQERFEVSREFLYSLVWSKPTIEVANILGVSDVAVAKRCKRLNVPKPPRGYWAKVKSGVAVGIPKLN